MDSSKLIKGLSTRNYMLVPHIERFLISDNLPDEWVIKIANKKAKRDYGDADIRFSPSSDTVSSVEDLVQKYTVGSPEDPITGAMRRTFDCGTMWHEYIQLFFTQKSNIPNFL